MNLTPQSPELTAYVLGELPDDQRREVEAILAVRPDLQQEVDQLRALTAHVIQALQGEPTWTLSPARRRSILERSNQKAKRFQWAWPWSVPDPRRWLPVLQLAGAALAAVAVGLLWWESRRPAGLQPSARTLAYVEPANALANTYSLASRSPRTNATPGMQSAAKSSLSAGDPSLSKKLKEQETVRLAELSASPLPTLNPLKQKGGLELSSPVERALALAPSNPPDSLPAGSAADSLATSALLPVIDGATSPPLSFAYESGRPLAPLSWSAEAPPSTVRFENLDDSGYRLVRTRILEGIRPLPEFVRLEELINYFRYDGLVESGSAETNLVRTRMEWAVCPWNPGHALLRVALQVKERTNSMAIGRRLTLAVDGTQTNLFALLPDWFGEAPTHLLVSTDRNEAVGESLTTAGSMAHRFSRLGRRAAVPTQQLAGSEGLEADLQRAYTMAKDSLVTNLDRPVILATIPARVTEISATQQIPKIIQAGTRDGVRLDVVALGVRPEVTPELAYWAGLGGGHLMTADTKAEGRRAFGELAQPAESETVSEWPATGLGWDTNRFTNWRALGNIPTTGPLASKPSSLEPSGALAGLGFQYRTGPATLPTGHQYVALFELATSQFEFPSPGGFGGLGPAAGPPRSMGKSPTSLTLAGVPPPFTGASVDFKFTAAVAGFGLLLRNTEDHGGVTWDLVLELARAGAGSDPDGSRAEFIELVRRARDLK